MLVWPMISWERVRNLEGVGAVPRRRELEGRPEHGRAGPPQRCEEEHPALQALPPGRRTQGRRGGPPALARRGGQDGRPGGRRVAVSTSDDAGSSEECPLTIIDSGMDCENCEQPGTSQRCITCLMAVCSLCCAAGECPQRAHGRAPRRRGCVRSPGPGPRAVGRGELALVGLAARRAARRDRDRTLRLTPRLDLVAAARRRWRLLAWVQNSRLSSRLALGRRRAARRATSRPTRRPAPRGTPSGRLSTLPRSPSTHPPVRGKPRGEVSSAPRGRLTSGFRRGWWS